MQLIGQVGTQQHIVVRERRERAEAVPEHPTGSWLLAVPVRHLDSGCSSPPLPHGKTDSQAGGFTEEKARQTLIRQYFTEILVNEIAQLLQLKHHSILNCKKVKVLYRNFTCWKQNNTNNKVNFRSLHKQSTHTQLGTWTHFTNNHNVFNTLII